MQRELNIEVELQENVSVYRVYTTLWMSSESKAKGLYTTSITLNDIVVTLPISISDDTHLYPPRGAYNYLKVKRVI